MASYPLPLPFYLTSPHDSDDLNFYSSSSLSFPSVVHYRFTLSAGIRLEKKGKKKKNYKVLETRQQ